MMLAAGAGREARLLGLAYELKEAVGWPRIQGPREALEQGARRPSPEPISHRGYACVSFSVVAPLAQSAERLHGKEKVYGSIP